MGSITQIMLLMEEMDHHISLRMILYWWSIVLDKLYQLQVTIGDKIQATEQLSPIPKE